MTTKPKILIWDIETSHSIVAAFGLFNQNISHENILEDFFIICGSWKFLGEDEVHSVKVIDDGEHWDDFNVVRTIRDVLEGVDLIIGHNIDKFDIKKLNTRMVYHGLSPLPKILSIDTLKIARKFFKFTSNRLDYIAQYLDVGAKMSVPKGNWLKVLQGDKEAINTLAEYNKTDVVINEKVYMKLRPYIHGHPHHGLLANESLDACPNCGSEKFHKRGYRITNIGKYQRYRCQDCSAWFASNTAERRGNMR